MHMNSRFECGQRHVHVGWIGGDAMVARAENSETAVYAGDRRAAAAGFALVTRHIRFSEIHAPGPLQQITSGGRHVPKLRRRAAQACFRKNGVVFLNERMVSQIRIAHDGANR